LCSQERKRKGIHEKNKRRKSERAASVFRRKGRKEKGVDRVTNIIGAPSRSNSVRKKKRKKRSSARGGMGQKGPTDKMGKKKRKTHM